MANYSIYPDSGGSGSIPTYANQAALPGSAADGSVAVTLDTDQIWVYDASALMWKVVGGPGVALSVGALDGVSASPNAVTIGSNSIYMQSASATAPGVVSSAAQTFSGTKTFNTSVLVQDTLGVAFANDTNTGIGRAGVDQGALVAAGVNGLTWGVTTGSSYSNVGIGAAPSASNSYPLLIQRELANLVAMQISNVSADAAASSKYQLAIEAGDKLAEVAVFPSTIALDAYTSRMTVRPNGNAAGLSLIGGDLATGDVRVYTGGDYTSAGRVAQFNADKSVQLSQAIAVPTTPSTGGMKIFQNSSSSFSTINSGGQVATLSGGNTGDITLTAVGTSPNNNAASLSGQALTLQPADLTSPGVVSSAAQTFGGVKTFNSTVTLNEHLTNIPTDNGVATSSSANVGSLGTRYIILSNPSLVSVGTINNQGVTTGTRLLMTNMTGNTVTFQHAATVASGDLSAHIHTPYSNSFPISNMGSAEFIYNGSQSAWLYARGTEQMVVGNSFAPGFSGSQSATIASNTLSLHIASGINQGIVSIGIQNFLGAKTFTTAVGSPQFRIAAASSNIVTLAANGSQSAYTFNVPQLAGTTGQAMVYTNANGSTSWQSILTNPMTATGDIIIGSASGVATRLAISSTSQVLQVGSDSMPQWGATPMPPATSMHIRSAGVVSSSFAAGAPVVFPLSGLVWDSTGSGGGYASNGRYYARQSGYYNVSFNVGITGTFVAGSLMLFYLTTGSATWQYNQTVVTGNASVIVGGISTQVYLNAGDSVEPRVNTNAGTPAFQADANSNWFSVHMIGR